MLVKLMLIISMMFSFPVYDIPLDYELQKEVYKESQKYEIGYELCLAVAKVESTFNPNADSGSSKGLFQLHVNTFPWIAKELGIENFDPFNPSHNLRAGIFYLDYLRGYWTEQGYSDEEVFNLMLISYNMGISNCIKYVKKHGLEYSYVNKVFEYKSFLEKNGSMYTGDLRR